MNLKQALQRIVELERKVKELEARPPEQHIHYHSAPVVPHPDLVPPPMWPQPYPHPTYDPYRWIPPMPVIFGGGHFR